MRQHFKPQLAGLLIGLLLCSQSFAGVKIASVPLQPETLATAFWVDSTVCSVVSKVPMDASKPILIGTPIDQFVSAPAICTSSVSGQNQVAGGVRNLLLQGFRITGVSHSVTPLATADVGKYELLLSAIFTLERPQSTNTGAGTSR